MTSLHSLFQLDRNATTEQWSRLTPREREVAELLAHGLPNRLVAERLGISPKTLDIHRDNVKKKLEAKTLAGIAKAFFFLRLADLLDRPEPA
ncbi:MAG: LuxR C-terminal-related transcriptional regulator [Gemmataceae bacterium]